MVLQQEKQREKNVATDVADALATQLAGDTRPPLILAHDEGCFGRISRPHACWAPSKRRPDVPSHVVREAISAYTAVALSLGKRCTLLLPTADTEAMNMFLQEVSRTFPQYVLIMQVDGAGWHHAKELVLPENMRLMTQTPSSPELNTFEHI